MTIPRIAGRGPMSPDALERTVALAQGRPAIVPTIRDGRTLAQVWHVQMTKLELESLTVVKSGQGAELLNSSGFVQWFPDRDLAYARIHYLRTRGPR